MEVKPSDSLAQGPKKKASSTENAATRRANNNPEDDLRGWGYYVARIVLDKSGISATPEQKNGGPYLLLRIGRLLFSLCHFTH